MNLYKYTNMHENVIECMDHNITWNISNIESRQKLAHEKKLAKNIRTKETYHKTFGKQVVFLMKK